jgi:hypothetical protein
MKSKLVEVTDESNGTGVSFYMQKRKRTYRRKLKETSSPFITIPGHPDDLYNQLLLLYHFSKSLTKHGARSDGGNSYGYCNRPALMV